VTGAVKTGGVFTDVLIRSAFLASAARAVLVVPAASRCASEDRVQIERWPNRPVGVRRDREDLKKSMSIFLLAFPALFSIVNPLGVAFIFLSATERFDLASRAAMARWIAIYLFYRYADTMSRWFGPTGTSVITRLSAFLLFCIGIQIFWNGAAELLGSLPR
jgi:hypothetical protein